MRSMSFRALTGEAPLHLIGHDERLMQKGPSSLPGGFGVDGALAQLHLRPVRPAWFSRLALDVRLTPKSGRPLRDTWRRR